MVFWGAFCYSETVKRLKFSLISLSILTVLTGPSARALPGCYSLIKGRVMTPAQAQALPPDCRTFHKKYQEFLKLLSRDAIAFESKLVSQIRSSRNETPPYDEILISSFLKNPSPKILSALQARAELENRNPWKYRYSAALLSRIQQGNCSEPFQGTVFDEVCRSNDPVFERVEKLMIARRKLK